MVSLSVLVDVWKLALGASLIGQMAMTCSVPVLAATLANTPVIDPDVRSQATAGRARVIVELRVPEAGDARAEAIARAQDVVLARVPAVLVRRYQSVPQLALEIDAIGLRALEALGDVVARVGLDRAVRPQ